MIAFSRLELHRRADFSNWLEVSCLSWRCVSPLVPEHAPFGSSRLLCVRGRCSRALSGLFGAGSARGRGLHDARHLADLLHTHVARASGAGVPVLCFWTRCFADVFPSQVTSLLFWFQGGPGGSSWIGLASEMGPIEFLDANTAQYRPINWLQANHGKVLDLFRNRLKVWSSSNH